MDDFINKVGVGPQPRLQQRRRLSAHATGWCTAARSDEQKFKYYLRRHQMPTQVWYKAYPGLTAVDLERNERIREGLEQPSMSDARGPRVAAAALRRAPMTQAADRTTDDIQGLVRFGYGHLTRGVLPAAARRPIARPRARWLARGAGHAAPTTLEPPPATALQVAFTQRRPASARRCRTTSSRASPPSSSSGMAGDAQPLAPARRRRRQRPGALAVGRRRGSVPHVLVMLFARARAARGLAKRDRRAALARRLRGAAPASTTGDLGRHRAVRLRATASASRCIDWERERAARDARHARLRQPGCLGEFLLGYPNEYGAYTDRPLLDPRAIAERRSCRAPRTRPSRRDLGRNGSYLVMRQLRAGRRTASGSSSTRRPAAIRERASTLAEAMVGRTIDGRSARSARDREPIDGVAQRRRRPATPVHLRRRPDGMRCPFGAHIRRAIRATPTCRPAAGLHLGADRARWASSRSARATISIASTRFHRILRRGREYGPWPRRGSAPARRRERRDRACTSSASTPTSRASSSSCRAPG